MAPLVLWILLLIVSLAALVKGADWFTEAAEDIGIRLHLSPFIVGVLIVSVGTSIPELASSIAAVLQGSSEIVMADVVGSNITNLLLGFGLIGLATGGFKLRHSPRDILTLVISMIVVFLLSFTGTFSRFSAVIVLFLFLFYILLLLREKQEHKKARLGWGKTLTLFSIGACAVVGGAHYLVVAIKVLAATFSISTSTITASIVALGTSAPEIIVSVVAATKKRHGISIGNIIGSNTFNILAITGISGLFAPLEVSRLVIVFAFPALLFSTLLFGLVTRDGVISRKEGAFLTCCYAVYILLLFII